jgi:hypothetical protein
MIKYKREAINNQNEQIYNMLKSAGPTYTFKEWGEHTNKNEKLR